jgi:hypothetical protein
MSYLLKTLIYFLIFLFGQSQAGLATGPVGPDGEFDCSKDGICRVNECRATPDPDCELPTGSSGNTNPPATLGLTGQPSATGISGFAGSKFTRGSANSTDMAVYAILSRERSNKPCYVAVGAENVNNAALDSTPTPEIDLCGPKGPTSSTLHADYLDTNAGGSNDKVFVSGVRVCMDRGDDRVKGIHVHGKRLTTSGTLVDFSPDAQDSRTNCHQDHWQRWADCPTDQIATAVDLHFGGGNTPRSLIGIGLQCRAVAR